MTQAMHGLDIFIKNLRGIWKGCHGLLDTGFAQQMQGWIRRTVGIVGEVIRFGIGKLLMRMHAGHLQLAFQINLRQSLIHHF